MGNYADVSVVFCVSRCLPSADKLHVLVVYQLRSRWCEEHFTYFLFQKLTILAFISKFYSMGLYIKLQNKDPFSWLSVICLRPGLRQILEETRRDPSGKQVQTVPPPTASEKDCL